MAAPEEIAYLGMVALVSLSGVMAPGPLLATTICQGYQDKRAGLGISFGHAMVEVPLIIAIFLGLGTILNNTYVFIAIGLIGGAILLYMGWDLIRSKDKFLVECPIEKRSSFRSAIVMTAANPYWLIWWATAGAALVAGAVVFGPIMLPLFIIVHFSCDLAWYLLVSYSVNRSKELWSRKWHRLLFIGSGTIMFVFGLYFLLSSASSILMLG
jgi:threonine/homoserine/homoserine lactone efflux protein